MTEKTQPALRTNLIDRVVEIFSPGAAVGRARARQALSSYRGAIAGRFGQTFGDSVSYRNGTTRDRRDQASMRNRGRRAYLEYVVARSLLDTETDYIVGDGFTLQMRTASPAFNEEAERRFYKWLDRADVTGRHTGTELQRMSWRETRKDGDGGLLLITRGGYPYLQYIPGDLIRNPQAGWDSRTTFDGVRVDPAGRAVEYYVRDVDEQGKDITTGVSARDFVFIAHLDAPNNVRGTTVYSPIFAHLDQLDTYVDSVTQAAIMGTIFGLVEKRTNPQAAQVGLGLEQNASGRQQTVVKFEGGMMKVLTPEEGMYQIDAKQPMQQTPEFIRAIARIAALGFDMPLEIAFRDVSQVNFSGGRIGLLGFYRSCRIKQGSLKTYWARIVFWWLSVERRRQELGYADAFANAFPADYGEFELHGREFEANDRRAEAEADLLEFSLGKPLQRIFAERGWDYEGDLPMWQAHIERLRTAGLPVVLSTSTRDERQKTTAVDADGNPVKSGPGLNGVQVTAVLDVLSKLVEKTIMPSAAKAVLTGLGLAVEDVDKMVAEALARTGVAPGDRDFQREVLKSFATIPQAREAIFNATDIEDLVAQTGLPPEAGYEVPYAAVVAPAGQLNSGAVITDPQGDIVGGDVVNELPAEQSGRNVSPPPSATGDSRPGGSDETDDDEGNTQGGQ
jgi:capsid protein/antitoxin component of RelBE/YafQ-DinJ toxin-antitoxin module